MVPELADAAFAVVLGFAAVIAAMAGGATAKPVRAYLRFAAGLAAALAAADLVAALGRAPDFSVFADAVTLLIAGLAPAMLALAAAVHFGHGLRAAPAAALLIVACIAGLGGAATGSTLLGFAPLAAASIALGAFALQSWQRGRKTALLLGLSAAAILAAAAAYMSGAAAGRTGFALFLAAGLLGVALALARRSHAAVEDRSRKAAHRDVFIGGKD